jgi:hypothetical protein
MNVDWLYHIVVEVKIAGISDSEDRLVDVPSDISITIVECTSRSIVLIHLYFVLG